MIFSFLKYLQPTNYFVLNRHDGTSVFPKFDNLPEEILEQLETDFTYSSKTAQNYDLSWQAIQKGYIGNALTYSKFERIPLEDDYRFIRKYFHKIWVFYVLAIRIFSFYNPIREISACYNTRNVKRNNYLMDPIKYKGWNTFESQLIQAAPKISVVIPTLNRYTYLKDVLKDFELQDYKNFEIIIVDQSEPFQDLFYDQFLLDIKVVRQKEKALWLARNKAIKKAKGIIIALSEDDVRIESNWLSNHLKCLDFFKADISAGVFHPNDQKLSEERSFFKIASQFATGNSVLYKDVFKKIGLFDRQFEKQRMGDGEFGLRAYLSGFKSISNPLASCIDVKAEVGGLREMGSWDAFRTKKWLAPIPIPSVLYLFRKYYGNSRAKLSLLKMVPISIIPYRFKRSRKLIIVGAILLIIVFPIILFQVFKSWRLSSIKLKQGDLIERLS